ncbi:MAG: pimeloyl-ACP methyl ester esterase BioH [Tahibacter sp.]
MHIETKGDGPDLVLVHGWAMHSGIFAPLTRALADRYRLHLVDLPGHGASPERPATLDLADCARRIAERVPRALWIGWSLGGLVCLHAALQGQASVAALALIATNPRFVIGENWPHGVAQSVFSDFATGLHRDYRRTIERFLALEAHGSEHALAELRELKAHVFDRGEPDLQAMCSGLDLLAGEDLRLQLAQLAVPSLWMAGRRDRLVPASAMQWAAHAARSGRYLDFSAGHAPFIGHAAAIADAIDHFHHATVLP